MESNIGCENNIDCSDGVVVSVNDHLAESFELSMSSTNCVLCVRSCVYKVLCDTRSKSIK